MATAKVLRLPAPIEKVTLELSAYEAESVLRALETIPGYRFEEVSSIAALLRQAIKPVSNETSA